MQLQRPNWWLTDKDFLNSLKYEDKDYLSKLFEDFRKSFLHICPTPVVVKYLTNSNSIEFWIGNNNLGSLPIDNTISTLDFCVLAKEKCYRFYPSYDSEFEVETELKRSPQEIVSMMEKNPTLELESLMYYREKRLVKEHGVIEKVYIKDDQFRIIINNVPQIRHCKIPLSKFLESLRELMAKNIDTPERGLIIKNFIDTHSSVLHEVHFYTDKKKLDIHARQYKNFFRINFPYLKGHELIFNEATNTYEWERYIIDFPTKKLEEDCLKIYNQLKEESNNG